MRKTFRIAALALALLLIAQMLPALAASNYASSAEELTALLAQCRANGANRLQVNCSKDFFARLYANRFAEITPMLWEAGFEDASLRYSDSACILLFENFQKGKVNFARVSTIEEVRSAVRGFAESKCGSFNLACASDELFNTLFRQNGLYAPAGYNGIEDFDLRGGGNICHVENVQYSTLPTATADSDPAFLAAISAFAAAGMSEFVIAFEEEYYRQLEENADQKRVLLAVSQLADYRYRNNSYFCNMRFSEVSFTGEPKVVCRSEEDIVDSIRQFGAAGEKNFSLILNGELYETVHENGFDRLHELETEAGMTDCGMSYDMFNYVLIYSDARIAANARKLTTVDEAAAVFENAAMEGERIINLFCTKALYDQLMEGWSQYSIGSNKLLPLFDLIAQAGIFDYTYSCSEKTHLLMVSVDSYYPGTNIIRAIGKDDPAALTEREAQTMNAAIELAQACRMESDLDTAAVIHDAICEMTTYVNDETTDEDDTAIGVLLNGEANCDGYADAFCLVGTLAGLDVRYQHGDGYSDDPAAIFSDETHMWNLISLDGSWRMVDVTWDDADDQISYTWFDLGHDRATRTHQWNEDMTVALKPDTDPMERPENEYLIESQADVNAAIEDAVLRGYDRFYLYLADGVPNEVHDAAIRAFERAALGPFVTSWNHYMRTLMICPHPEEE